MEGAKRDDRRRMPSKKRQCLPLHAGRLGIKMYSALNLGFAELDQAFAVNRLLASATIDRLRHNVYCLELNGPPYRDPKVGPAPKKTAQKASVNTAK